MRLQNFGKIETGTSITFPVASNAILQRSVNIHILGKGFLFPNISVLPSVVHWKRKHFLFNQQQHSAVNFAQLIAQLSKWREN